MKGTNMEENKDQKSLITIVSEAANIERMLIESGGVITPELEKALSINSSELSTKADGYSIIIERFKSLEEFYSVRAKFYSEIANRCAASVVRLKDNIKFAMSELQTTEIKGEDVRFVVRPTKGKLVIDDIEMIPVEFKEEKIETIINKDKLKAALLIAPVAGASLEAGVQLNIYANTPKPRDVTDKKSSKKSKEVENEQ